MPSCASYVSHGSSTFVTSSCSASGDAFCLFTGPPTLRDISPSRGLLASAVIRHECVFDGSRPLNVTWLHNGNPVEDGDGTRMSNELLVMPQASGADSGYYQCVAVNDVGRAHGSIYLFVAQREGK